MSSRGLIRQQFILPQLYYIIDRQRTPSKGYLTLLCSLLPLFLLSLRFSELLSLISTPQSLLILYRAFIPMSYIPTSASISKSIIVSSSSPSLTSQLYTLYRLAINIRFAAFSLILNYPSLKLTIVIYRGLPIGCSLPYIPCNPYVPIQSSNITRRRFQPVKAQDSQSSPLVLKVGNARKAPTSPQLITYYFYLYNLAYSYSRSC